MAGLITDADKERVREANRIESVVGEYVALKPAGGGNLKGLCPFHDEKSPSFHVRPSHGTYHCFGCGEGGDVFSFIAEIEHLTFVETVERLAERVGIVLTRVQGTATRSVDTGSRSRLLAANKAAAAFFAEQLDSAEAVVAREFLAQRGFDREVARDFGCGYAPGGWDRMVKALTAQGFSLPELYKAGLARQGQRGPIDQFQRRLLWSIRDAAGDVVGFGARRLFDDDRIEAKYVNTAETPLYRKSQVLYGLDRAKREIAKQRRAVIVEGYTDVMAMHLAGITTAVASCGTAFGDEHIAVLRRYLLDSDVIRGEVIYTFDGDAAGQKAALKAFASDQKFAANTFVAIAPDGMDPCDLRLAQGNSALRTLVDSRKNLFAFAIRSTLAGYDLDTPEGRVAATNATIPLVAKIKGEALREEYARELAGWLGADPQSVLQRVRGAARAAQAPAPPAEARRPHQTSLEREVLKLAVQVPQVVAADYSILAADAFTDPVYRRVHEAIVAAGGPPPEAIGPAWMEQVSSHLPAGPLRSMVSELGVEPPRVGAGQTETGYAGGVLAAMGERVAAAEESVLASALRRAEADGDRTRVAELQTDLLEVTAYRRALALRARGELS